MLDNYIHLVIIVCIVFDSCCRARVQGKAVSDKKFSQSLILGDFFFICCCKLLHSYSKCKNESNNKQTFGGTEFEDGLK